MRHFDTSSFRQNIYEKPFGIYQIDTVQNFV